jgi:hypothetical protein
VRVRNGISDGGHATTEVSYDDDDDDDVIVLDSNSHLTTTASLDCSDRPAL